MIRYHKKAAELLSQVIAPELASSEEIYQLLERPQNPEHGDIAFPCFLLSKQLRNAPVKISQELTGKIQALAASPFLNWPHGWKETFESIEATGPYINFRLNAAAAMQFLEEALAQGKQFGSSTAGNQQKILIEYSSPNVAKEFHIGHFRNTILGQSLFNLYGMAGYKAIAVNHVGDWGSQFGKVAYAFTHWGDEKLLEHAPLAYLTTLYVRFHEESEKNPDLDREARLLFKKIEDKDPEFTRLWRRFVDLSIEDLKRIYVKLGVRFDEYLGESFYFDKVAGLLDLLRDKKLLVESEGAQIVSLAEFDMPPCLILTGDGTTLYHTRDLAAAIYRKNHFKFDKCLYVVGSEQSLHFQQVFKVLELMGFEWAKNLEHIRYGLYRFKDGKFSTRKGKVVLFEEVLQEAKAKVSAIIEQKNAALKNKEQVAEMVALGALVFNDLVTDRVKDVEFDWNKILDFEGDTGPYLQYTHARASSILRKARDLKVARFTLENSQKSGELGRHPSALALMKNLGRFSSTVEGAVRLNKPSLVAHYSLDLAKSFNSFYRSVKVLDDNESAEAIQARLLLVEAAKNVLSNSLRMICMGAPEEM